MFWLIFSLSLSLSLSIHLSLSGSFVILHTSLAYFSSVFVYLYWLLSVSSMFFLILLRCSTSFTLICCKLLSPFIKVFPLSQQLAFRLSLKHPHIIWMCLVSMEKPCFSQLPGHVMGQKGHSYYEQHYTAHKQKTSGNFFGTPLSHFKM